MEGTPAQESVVQTDLADRNLHLESNEDTNVSKHVIQGSGPALQLSSSEHQWSVAELYERGQLILSYEWPLDSAVSNLGTIRIPEDLTKLANHSTVMMRMYSFFNSSFTFEITLNSSAFHSGCLMLVWIPTGFPNRIIGPSTAAQYPHVIIDASKSNSGILEVPFINIQSLNSTITQTAVSLGELIVYACTPLSGQDGVHGRVTGSVFMKMKNENLSVPIPLHSMFHKMGPLVGPMMARGVGQALSGDKPILDIMQSAPIAASVQGENHMSVKILATKFSMCTDTEDWRDGGRNATFVKMALNPLTMCEFKGNNLLARVAEPYMMWKGSMKLFFVSNCPAGKNIVCTIFMDPAACHDLGFEKSRALQNMNYGIDGWIVTDRINLGVSPMFEVELPSYTHWSSLSVHGVNIPTSGVSAGSVYVKLDSEDASFGSLKWSLYSSCGDDFRMRGLLCPPKMDISYLSPIWSHREYGTLTIPRDFLNGGATGQSLGGCLLSSIVCGAGMFCVREGLRNDSTIGSLTSAAGAALCLGGLTMGAVSAVDSAGDNIKDKTKGTINEFLAALGLDKITQKFGINIFEYMQVIRLAIEAWNLNGCAMSIFMYVTRVAEDLKGFLRFVPDLDEKISRASDWLTGWMSVAVGQATEISAFVTGTMTVILMLSFATVSVPFAWCTSVASKLIYKLDAVSKGIRGVTDIKTRLPKIAETIHEVMDTLSGDGEYTRLMHAFKGSPETLQLWAQGVLEMSSVPMYDEMCVNKQMRDLAHSLFRQGLDFVTRASTCPTEMAFKGVWDKCQELEKHALKMDKFGGSRVMPFTIIFQGPHGVMKSTLAKKLSLTLLTEVLEYAGESSVYHRNDGDPFWSCYSGQPCIFFDDMNQNKDAPPGQLTMCEELMKMSDTLPVHLNMAASEDKGKNTRGILHIATSNIAWFVPSRVASKEAMFRRRHVQVNTRLELPDEVGGVKCPKRTSLEPATLVWCREQKVNPVDYVKFTMVNPMDPSTTYPLPGCGNLTYAQLEAKLKNQFREHYLHSYRTVFGATPLTPKEMREQVSRAHEESQYAYVKYGRLGLEKATQFIMQTMSTKERMELDAAVDALKRGERLTGVGQAMSSRTSSELQFTLKSGESRSRLHWKSIQFEDGIIIPLVGIRSTLAALVQSPCPNVEFDNCFEKACERDQLDPAETRRKSVLHYSTMDRIYNEDDGKFLVRLINDVDPLTKEQKEKALVVMDAVREFWIGRKLTSIGIGQALSGESSDPKKLREEWKKLKERKRKGRLTNTQMERLVTLTALLMPESETGAPSKAAVENSVMNDTTEVYGAVAHSKEPGVGQAGGEVVELKDIASTSTSVLDEVQQELERIQRGVDANDPVATRQAEEIAAVFGETDVGARNMLSRFNNLLSDSTMTAPATTSLSQMADFLLNTVGEKKKGTWSKLFSSFSTSMTEQEKEQWTKTLVEGILGEAPQLTPAVGGTVVTQADLISEETLFKFEGGMLVRGDSPRANLTLLAALETKHSKERQVFELECMAEKLDPEEVLKKTRLAWNCTTSELTLHDRALMRGFVERIPMCPEDMERLKIVLELLAERKMSVKDFIQQDSASWASLASNMFVDSMAKIKEAVTSRPGAAVGVAALLSIPLYWAISPFFERNKGESHSSTYDADRGRRPNRGVAVDKPHHRFGVGHSIGENDEDLLVRNKNTLDVAMTLSRNCIKVRGMKADGTTHWTGGFMVKGTVLLLPKHFLYPLSSTWLHLEKEEGGRMIYHDVDINGSKRVTLTRADGSLTDIEMVCLEGKLSPFKDTTCHFMSREEVERYYTVEGVLMGVDVRGGSNKVLLTKRELRRITDFEYYVPNKRQEQVVIGLTRGWQYEGLHMNGDCGHVMMADSNQPHGKIIGMHIAGGRDHSFGVSELLDKEMIVRGLKDLDSEVTVECFEMDGLKFSETEEPRAVPAGNLTKVGVLCRDCTPFMGTKTTLEKSEIFGLFPNSVQPAVLSPQDPRLKEKRSIIRTAVEKFGEPLFPFPHGLVTKATDHLSATVKQFRNYPGGPRRLTISEAALGCGRSTFHAGLALDTSCGYPHILNITRQGLKPVEYKRKLLESASNDPQSVPAQRIAHVISRWGKGEMIGLFAVDKLKDEKRPHAKIAAGLTRGFDMIPVEIVVAVRMLTLDFAAAMYANHGKFFSMIGVNPESPEWDSLYRSLHSFSETGVDADYKSFDGKIPMTFAYEFAQLMNGWYGTEDEAGRRDARCRRTMMMEVINTPMIMMNYVYIKHQGNPSGFALTALFNCFCNAMYIRIGWMMVRGDKGLTTDLNVFDNEIMDRNYGDDLIAAVKPNASVDFQEIATILGEHGVVMTAGDKSPSIVNKPILELTFLKRRFLIQPNGPYKGHVTAILEKKSIYGMLNWIRKTSCASPKIALEQNMYTALGFLSFHIDDDYDKLERIIKKKGYSVPIPSRFDMQYKVMQSDRPWDAGTQVERPGESPIKTYGIGQALSGTVASPMMGSGPLQDLVKVAGGIVGVAGSIAPIGDSIIKAVGILGDTPATTGHQSSTRSTHEPMSQTGIPRSARRLATVAVSVIPEVEDDGVDEMDLRHVCSKANLVSRMKIEDQDKKVRFLPVNPMVMETESGKGVGSVMAYYAHGFEFWRGDMEYMVSVFASGFATGRLAISWIPDLDEVPTEDPKLLMVYPTVVLDIQLERDIRFRIPYLARTPLKRVPRILSEKDNTTWYFNPEENCGILAFHWLNMFNQAQNPKAVAQVWVWQNGGKNFELSVPRDQRKVIQKLSDITSVSPTLSVEIPKPLASPSLTRSPVISPRGEGQCMTQTRFIPLPHTNGLFYDTSSSHSMTPRFIPLPYTNGFAGNGRVRLDGKPRYAKLGPSSMTIIKGEHGLDVSKLDDRASTPRCGLVCVVDFIKGLLDCFDSNPGSRHTQTTLGDVRHEHCHDGTRTLRLGDTRFFKLDNKRCTHDVKESYLSHDKRTGQTDVKELLPFTLQRIGEVFCKLVFN